MGVLRQFYFFSRKDFTHTKSTKSIKSTKTQINDFHSDVFYTHIKHKKHKNHKSFLLVRCFYAHKNNVFFVHIKSIKTHISE